MIDQECPTSDSDSAGVSTKNRGAQIFPQGLRIGNTIA